MLVSEIVRRNAEFFPDSDAVVVHGGPTSSWADLEERSNRTAHVFVDELGLSKGDRIATVMGNGAEFYDFFFACAKTGVVGAPTNVRLAPAEIVKYLRIVAPRAILAGADHAGAVREVVKEVPSIEHVIGVGDGHGFDLDLAALRDAHPVTDPGVAVDENDVYQLAATSGTTGTPKAAIVTQRNAMAAIVTWGSEHGTGEGGTNLQVIPMFFNPGGPSGLHPVMMKGGRTVVLGAFDPGAFLEAVERYRATHSIIVPTMLGMVLNHPTCGTHDYSSLRAIGSGGSPVPLPTVERARATFGDVVFPMYGLAETFSCGMVLRPESQVTEGSEEEVRRLMSAGKPMLLMQVRVVGDDGAEVPKDNATSGEIWLRGDSVSSGYFEMPEETASSREGDWFKTGDIAVVDHAGYVTIVDRKKDIIITGGINVFSREVEEALFLHPAVDQVAVIGIPDEKWGEAIHAVLTLRPGAEATVAELVDFAAERLAGFKKPRSLEIVAELPVGGTGKVLKKELRERYWEGRDRPVG